MADRGLFITFEGIEGSGKTSQIRRLGERLLRLGQRVVVTREPGGCPIADDIRRILLHPDSSALVPRAELLLYAAARAQHVEEVIRPGLAGGAIVLCDRFTDATLAYQGGGRGLDRTLITELNTLATSGILPDLTLLLDLPAADGLLRAHARNEALALHEEGRFEAEHLDFHCRVRQGYLDLALATPRFAVIDATGTRATVEAQIDHVVAQRFGLRVRP
ncbi:MAG: dTMP kinase [Desulfuromonadales bacterium GWD2_61_12]|nr:MAG: dTMP kinase [Desulfuromonadales bacterium GWC2_61_20]OGR33738.1 MAG: dTMP kinase [Desulfuromonadales bacterium GWD2_61_12]HBT82298.1 dTMP kinase [Desulfuromonas sp.]